MPKAASWIGDLESFETLSKSRYCQPVLNLVASVVLAEQPGWELTCDLLTYRYCGTIDCQQLNLPCGLNLEVYHA